MIIRRKSTLVSVKKKVCSDSQINWFTISVHFSYALNFNEHRQKKNCIFDNDYFNSLSRFTFTLTAMLQTWQNGIQRGQTGYKVSLGLHIIVSASFSLRPMHANAATNNVLPYSPPEYECEKKNDAAQLSKNRPILAAVLLFHKLKSPLRSYSLQMKQFEFCTNQHYARPFSS